MTLTHLLCVLFLIVPIALGRTDKEVIKSSLKIKGKTFKCSFTMVSANSKVNLKQSKLACTPGKPKKQKASDIVLEGELGTYTVSVSINPSKITKASMTPLAVTTVTPAPGPPAGGCGLAYTEICTLGSYDTCQEDFFLRCFGPETETESPTGDAEQCSCLLTEQVTGAVNQGRHPFGRCGVPRCVCISTSLLSSQECSVGSLRPVNTTAVPTVNLANAVSVLTSLSSKQKAKVRRALETSSAKFSQMEDTFNQKRFKRKWVQSTPETSSMGQKTRLTDNLVDTTSKTITSLTPYQLNLLESNLNTQLAEQGYRMDEDCDSKYRSLDGSCNNLASPRQGAAGEPMPRLMDNAYSDGVSLPRGGRDPSVLPSARSVSVAVHQVPQNRKMPNVSHMVMQFGQFLDHDITLTSQPEGDCCSQEVLLEESQAPPQQRRCFNIDISGDAFFQSKPTCGAHPFSRSDRVRNPRPNQSQNQDQINGITSYIDGSNVYGSTVERSNNLRSLTDGQMKTHVAGGPTLPTRRQCGFSSQGTQDPEDLVAGDARAIVQPALASIHSLFLNEHNRVAAELKTRVSNFLTNQGGMNDETLDETLFQETRRIVAAELQQITYQEFLPSVLGARAWKAAGLDSQEATNTEYDDQADASIVNEFATVAYRFGHTLIAGFFNGNGGWPLRFHFFEFNQFVLGLEKSGDKWFSEMREAARQASPSADTAMVPDLTNFLFGDPTSFGDDLAARNIQRGRDHGIPSYNSMRTFCGLNSLTMMNEPPLEINDEDWDNLAKVYTSVDQIDGFSGGLAEQPTDPDSLVGPTFSCILTTQFQRLMRGDRFFFAHPPSSLTEVTEGLKSRSLRTVQSRSLSDIICDNTDAQTVPEKAMLSQNLALQATKSCANANGLDFAGIAEDILEEFGGY